MGCPFVSVQPRVPVDRGPLSAHASRWWRPGASARCVRGAGMAMSNGLQAATDAILQRVVSGTPRVPGVVAMATDRKGNIYEGAAGKRMLGQDADMTTD